MENKLPRINAYQCEYGCVITTVDVDHGVTPFSIKCRAKARPDRPLNPKLVDKHGECKGMANSCFYPKSPLPKNLRSPEWQWEKQSESTFAYAAKRYGVSIEEIKGSYRDQPNQLILVPRDGKAPVYHE